MHLMHTCRRAPVFVEQLGAGLKRQSRSNRAPSETGIAKVVEHREHIQFVIFCPLCTISHNRPTSAITRPQVTLYVWFPWMSVT